MSAHTIGIAAARMAACVPAAQERRLVVLNFSAGVQSSALLWMVLRGEIPRPRHLLVLSADPGMENSETYAYRDAMFARCRDAGIACAVAPGPDLYQDLIALSTRCPVQRLDNPPYFTDTGILGHKCTRYYKIEPMNRYIRGWLAEHFAIPRHTSRIAQHTVIKWIGFAADEWRRVRDKDNRKRVYIRLTYPLIRMKLTRAHIDRYYQERALPKPPPSRCIACFANTAAYYRDMAQNRPDDWRRAVAVDQAIRDLSAIGVDDDVFVYRGRIPLTELARRGFGDKDPGAYVPPCDQGYCFV